MGGGGEGGGGGGGQRQCFDINVEEGMRGKMASDIRTAVVTRLQIADCSFLTNPQEFDM